MLDVTALISRLPDDPGVYLMKDINDTVIYVGKAANLSESASILLVHRAIHAILFAYWTISWPMLMSSSHP